MSFAPPPALDDPGRIVDAGGLELWCSDLGEGDPLMLVGGFTAGHHVFDFVRPHLDGLRTITWEPRGLGRSARPEGAYSVELWADDLARLLDALEVERAHLWAVGFGNFITVRFAAEYPDRVGAVAGYTDVWAADPAKGYGRIWNVYKAIIDNFGTSGFGARMLTGIFDVPLPWFPAWEARNVEEVVHTDTAERTIGYCLTQADVRAELPRIRAPFLVVQGDQGWAGERLDPADDPSLQLMREAMPQLELAVIPDSHAQYVLAQRPRECAAAVKAFLGAHPLKAAGVASASD
jgi:pimeloyl-ACP methyl ester carboxylesterase